jgi:hypothetical protein
MTDQDKGTIEALLKRLPFRLERAQALKTRVDAGEMLLDSDIAFLQRVVRDSETIRPILSRHPEYQQLAAQAMDLYQQITKAALENESRNTGNSE